MSHPLVADVFKLAQRHALEPHEMIFLLADVLAATAVTVDLDPSAAKSSLDDKLDSFVERVRERYPQVMDEMLALRKAQLDTFNGTHAAIGKG